MYVISLDRFGFPSLLMSTKRSKMSTDIIAIDGNNNNNNSNSSIIIDTFTHTTDVGMNSNQQTILSFGFPIQCQPIEVIISILSYLEHIVGNVDAVRYVNKQWFHACQYIKCTIAYPPPIWGETVQSDGQKKYSNKFKFALRLYPRATSFVHFPLNDINLFLSDPTYSSTLTSLQSIGLITPRGTELLSFYLPSPPSSIPSLLC
jgi:hypothetical protein